jgi:hypothetical protein
MEKLHEAMLIDEGLTPINSELMVKRYNDCLTTMGFSPTGLDNFRIDALGWSPEIALEKGDRFYMSHGEANQFAIVMRPAQCNKPVYHAYYSFSRDLMEDFFIRYQQQITQVTKSTAIWLDMDQDITSYENPYDLLMIDSFVVRVETLSGISGHAEHQRALAHKFMHTPEGWFDPGLRAKIIESAASHGDLRYKNVVLKDYHFTDLRSFYTAAFGGMYVLRDVCGDRDYLLIFLDESQARTYGATDPNVFYIQDPNLLALLRSENILRDRLSYYRKYPDTMEFIRECMLVDAISYEYPDIRIVELSSGQKKKYARELNPLLPDSFAELERLIRRLRSDTPPSSKSLSPELSTSLLYPDLNLPVPLRRILRHMLCELNPLDVMKLYIYHKEKFLEDYKNWPESKQRWAIDEIKSKYESRMNA